MRELTDALFTSLAITVSGIHPKRAMGLNRNRDRHDVVVGVCKHIGLVRLAAENRGAVATFWFVVHDSLVDCYAASARTWLLTISSNTV